MLNEVDLVSLLANGLPPPSYYGKDWQSDKEAARVFSPGSVWRVHWDSYGACLYMFFTSLTTGLSLSSVLWQGNSPLLLRNAMVGYYWTLLLIAEKWDGDESDDGNGFSFTRTSLICYAFTYVTDVVKISAGELTVMVYF